MLSLSTLVCVGLSLISACVAQDYVVEVLLVIDPISKQKWEADAKAAGNSVHQEVKSIMFEVNELFGNLRAQGLDIAIRLLNNRVNYVSEPVFSNKLVKKIRGETYVNYKEANKAFHLWAGDKTFDAAIYVTGHKFYNSTVGGVAYLDKVCRGGVGTISMAPTFSMATTIAHELGHILGLKHDGDNNTCAHNGGFIMSSVKLGGSKNLQGHGNAYYWSTCSAKTLKQILPKRSCLSPAKTTTVKNINAQRLGRLMSIDETCRRHGKKHLSRYSYKKGNYHDLCRSIPCETSLTIKASVKRFWFITLSNSADYSSTIFYVSPPPGMQCGPGHSCSHGRCVPDTKANKPWDSQCPFGDTPSLEDDAKTCGGAKGKGRCDLKSFKNICCKTC